MVTPASTSRKNWLSAIEHDLFYRQADVNQNGELTCSSTLAGGMRHIAMQHWGECVLAPVWLARAMRREGLIAALFSRWTTVLDPDRRHCLCGHSGICGIYNSLPATAHWFPGTGVVADHLRHRLLTSGFGELGLVLPSSRSPPCYVIARGYQHHYVNWQQPGSRQAFAA